MNQLKKMLFLSFLLFSFTTFAQKEQPEIAKEVVEEAVAIDADEEPEALAPAPSEEREVYRVVEEMPRFRGCEEMIGDKHGRQSCANRKMLEYLYGDLKYPPEARANGTEGMVIVKFVVEADGSLTNFEVTRDIGDGCGEAALAVLKTMPDWIPGKMIGREVAVSFNLPVKFKLANMPVKKETIENVEEAPKKKKKRKKKNKE